MKTPIAVIRKRETSTLNWLTVALALLLTGGAAAKADILLQSNFDVGYYNPPWTTSNTSYYGVASSRLQMFNGSTAAPLSVNFNMAANTPLTISLKVLTETYSDGGDWFMMSIKNSSSGLGYSVFGSGSTVAFGGGASASGFAYGNYASIGAPGVPGKNLYPYSVWGFQDLVFTFDPTTQLVTLTQDGTTVVSFTGLQSLGSVDTFDLRLSSFGGGPTRDVDNVLIEGTPGPVPEPAAAALLGVATLLLFRRRRL